MKTLRFALVPLAGPAAAFALAVAFTIAPARPRVAVASSHAEAPAIADDPAMDNTDVWAWQDSATTITIVTAWNGVSTPAGGPNYKKWVPFPQAVYEIHIDTNNDGVENLTYQFRFSNVDNGGSTFLRATRPGSATAPYERLQSAGDAAQKFNQTYTVTKITGARRSLSVPTTSATFAVAPPNTGPQLTWGRLGGVNESTPGTASVTNASTSVTTSIDLTAVLANGQLIQFGNQANTSYTVSALTAAGFTIAPAFSGPTNAATTILTLKTQTLIGAGSTTAPGNVPAPTAGNDYETQIAASAINSNVFGTGEKVFVGPRADAFFIDLGPTFDRLKIRTFGSPPGVSGTATRGPDVGQYGGGFNFLTGKNVEVIAIQIPVANIPASFPLGPGGALGTGYVGVWSSSSRSKVRILPTNTGTGQIRTAAGLLGANQPADTRDVPAGSYVQVSRLGNPLVNELFIPFDKKDAWNADVPANDAAHWAQYFSNPEVPGIINAVYGVPVPPPPRNDLQFLFAPDTLKVQTGKTGGGAVLTASSPAFVGAAVPLQGRTLGDDVTDIYLKAAAGILVIPANVNGGTANGGFGLAGAFGMPDFIPPAASTLFGAAVTASLLPGQPINGLLGDGVEYGTDGAGCGIKVTPSTFPYMPTPWDGQEVGNSYFQTPRHN